MPKATVQPGFALHFGDDEKAAINQLINVLKNQKEREQNAGSTGTSAKGDAYYKEKIAEYDSAISEIVSKIAKPAEGADYAKYASKTYRAKSDSHFSKLSKSEQERIEAMIERVDKALRPIDKLSVHALVSQKDQYWGVKIRVAKKKKSATNTTSIKSRDTAFIDKVLKKLQEANDIVKDEAKKEPSWLKNKLKDRK